MKAKDARKELEGLSGEELHKKASELYAQEVNQLTYARSHGKKPTVGIVESAVKQVESWFRRVYPGLAWSNEKTPLNIIEWESGEAYVRCNVVDPKLVAWGKRTRSAVLKGTPIPMLEAMQAGDLKAASAMMMARIRQDVARWGEVEGKRKAFAEKYGVKRCPYGAEKRYCEYQTTHVLDTDNMPTSTNSLVFVCTLSKCIESQQGGD